MTSTEAQLKSTENLGHIIIEKYSVSEVTRTGSHHSERHDETFYEESTSPKGTVTVKLYAEVARSKDTGEEYSYDELKNLLEGDVSTLSINRTDIDKAEVTINGEVFVVEYDISEFKDKIGTAV